MNGPVLRDIHLPPAHWWPPAPGWWLLAVVLLLAAIGVAWLLRRVTRGTALRAALREIDTLEAAHARDGNAAHLADGASRLMRRVALRVAPGVAAQTGATWHAFVRAHAPEDATRQALDTLARERFHAQPALDTSALLIALRTWCRSALRARAPTPFPGKGGANANTNAREAWAPQARKDETSAQYAPRNPAP